MAAAITPKDDLRRMLDDSREKMRLAISGMDGNKVIYVESGWRLKDIIAHLMAWELEVATSIRAYNDGKAYTIPDFSSDDDYNDLIFQRYHEAPYAQTQADWDAVRAGLISAMWAIPAARFDGQIMCPWELYSDIDGIVRDMVNHEAEHLKDILNKVD
ncbi:MAG: maleylpyruvate isomerase N-terminal domain-containing protein [Chloroflexota bacterium]